MIGLSLIWIWFTLKDSQSSCTTQHNQCPCQNKTHLLMGLLNVRYVLQLLNKINHSYFEKHERITMVNSHFLADTFSLF